MRGEKSAPQAGGAGTMADWAYEILKRAIMRGELGEGSFISEKEVTERYAISRTPFREACNRLQHEEFLEIVPRRGYLIPEMSFLRVRELFEARQQLESLIAELAAVRAEPAQIAEMEALISQNAQLGNSADSHHDLILANTQFHLCLARMTRNREFVKLMTSILERTVRIMYIELRVSRFQWTNFKDMHKPILEAIKERDPAAARRAVVQDIADAQIGTLGTGLKGTESGVCGDMSHAAANACDSGVLRNGPEQSLES
jgi:DNA-binding GntR family transcriptional regulator